MKRLFQTLLPLLLVLILLASLLPAALAEEPAADQEEESIIDAEFLDNWISEYLSAHDLRNNNQVFSVGFCYTATGDCWFYNGDAFLYSASMYKVPVSMLIAEKIAAGELGWEEDIVGGSVKYLVTSALINSNNDSGHALVDYLGGTYQGKSSDQCIGYTDLPRDYFVQDFFDLSYYSARFMTQVMTTLYEGGEERFPHVLECLLQAQPDNYMNLQLKGLYQVAQKYGAFVERNGNNNNHDAAIIYTPTPIVVVVMTRNVGDYENRIAEVGAYLAGYSITLDEKLAQREQERARQEAEAPQQSGGGLFPRIPIDQLTSGTDAQSSAPEQSAAAGGESAAPATPVPYFPGVQIAGGREKLMPAFWVMLVALALLILLTPCLARRRSPEPPEKEDAAPAGKKASRRP